MDFGLQMYTGGAKYEETRYKTVVSLHKILLGTSDFYKRTLNRMSEQSEEQRCICLTYSYALPMNKGDWEPFTDGVKVGFLYELLQHGWEH